MEQSALSNEEITLLKKHGVEFQKWLDSETGKKEMQDHRDHSNYFKSNLSSQNLPKMPKSDLVELYKNLWASHVWKNKDWNINQIIEKNGFDNLKNQLYQLLHGTESFERRYDSFREKIKGFGISIISEILNMIHPENYCLWNKKTKTVLQFLNLKQNLPERLFKYNLLTGHEYSQCVGYLNTIKNELSSFQIVDFVDLDIFFWYIHENIIPGDWKKDSKLEYEEEQEPDELQEKKNIIDLEKLIIEFDKNRELFGKGKITEKEAMELRSQFVSDFPADKILDIEIDNYVVGKKLADTKEPNRRTFCYRLEFELDGFGNIGGINAIKFGIYYSPKDKKYVYHEDKFRSAEEAYRKILSQINMLLRSGTQFTEEDDWKKLSDTFERVDTIKSVIKSKILSVYFPNSIVSINSENGIKQILKTLFQIPDEEIKEEFILKKQKLWELKQNHPIMRHWSNFDYSNFAWYAWKNSLNPSNKILSQQKPVYTNEFDTKFWVVRAGSGGAEENDALGNDVATIHWNGLSDISEFKDRDNLKSYYRRVFSDENDGEAAAGAGQVWSFLNEIKKDDIVILPLMSKHTKTVAIGVIIGDYEFREITPDVKHIRKVKW
ncbi:MAG TPA: hypothetical protein VK250_02170, partial [Nitrososphaeraceae archaeon]|nr:hypothetical protein [Nitrososphaeraceae archaeon]